MEVDMDMEEDMDMDDAIETGPDYVGHARQAFLFYDSHLILL